MKIFNGSTTAEVSGAETSVNISMENEDLTVKSGEVTYSASGLVPDSTYYWKITASDYAGHTTESAVKSFSTSY